MVNATENDRNQIVENLRILGICYLASGEMNKEARNRLSPRVLIKRIAEDSDPRLRLALIALFIRHPQHSTIVSDLVGQLNEPARTELKTFYTAAVYLQRFWMPRLKLYIKDFPLLPDLYSQELSLPKPEDRHGKNGLYALADWHASRSPYHFNWRASYLKVMDLLFAQLRMENNYEFSRCGESQPY
ncbi:MAG: hypothetical protein OXN17_22235 [Candidatus Poribacteria bacterium]|nr:hypothetical protein [Candidatus Poribacteria bacterium]